MFGPGSSFSIRLGKSSTSGFTSPVIFRSWSGPAMNKDQHCIAGTDKVVGNRYTACARHCQIGAQSSQHSSSVPCLLVQWFLSISLMTAHCSSWSPSAGGHHRSWHTGRATFYQNRNCCRLDSKLRFLRRPDLHWLPGLPSTCCGKMT